MAKAKVKGKKTVGDILEKMSADLFSNKLDIDNPQIPDIITFIESPEYLGLGTGVFKHVKLFPIQKAILKIFYRGSRGNENVSLTEDEIALLKKEGLYKEVPTSENDRGDLLGKYNNGVQFRELVLVWGRRSGKDFLVSLIALYEAMRLLEIPGGDPYEYYKLAPGADITILTIAASNNQAAIAFREIREKLRFSKYFENKVLSGGIQADCIYLLTKKDEANNKELEARNQQPKLGSVKIEVGHSNPDTLVGKSCYVLILDEVASYKSGVSGSSSGDKIYALLQPTTATYVKEVPILDENGVQKIDPETGEPAVDYIYEGKVISISSPRGKEGKLWSLWENHWKDPKVLGCRLPTWGVNKRQTEINLRREFKSMSETEFMCEFGADFSGTAGESMFSPELIDLCFKNNNKFREVGVPGYIYFVQLDPASNSHNYALVVCHKETFIDPKTNKSDFRILVDMIKVWSPKAKQPISVETVDDFVCSLRRRFHLGMVGYDAWQSQASIQKLRQRGIPAKEFKYLRKYKMEIYKELEELLKTGRIKIPYVGEEAELLRQEMIHLQRKWDGNSGFSVYHRKEGDVCKTDDVIDALAGAVYLAIGSTTNRLPKGKTVQVVHNPMGNNIVWRSMQGVPYGVGPGGAVARNLEKRNSWPNFKR
jgi:hypothetical protein